MKSLADSFLIALSMYSILPVKNLNWTEKNMRYAMAFFPLVGLAEGAALYLVYRLCSALGIGSLLYSALSIFSLIFVTGGIHLDGFCDTADALFSRRPTEQKLKILKDPNCGPFAVFSVILVIMIAAASFAEIYTREAQSYILLFTSGMFITRTLSGFSVVTLKSTQTSSLAKIFGENAGRSVRYILIAEMVLTSVLTIVKFGVMGVIELVLSALVFLYYYFMQKKQFGGITGDLAGFFLVLNETVWFLSAALFGGVLI